MSTLDPRRPHPGRVAFAAVVLLLALVAAGFAGWGWGVDDSTRSIDPHHVVAIVAGQPSMILLFIGSTFALPQDARTRLGTGVVIGGGLAALAVLMAVGMWVAGATTKATVVGSIGVLVFAGVVLARVRAARVARMRDEVLRTGVAVPGEVCQVGSTGEVNGVPRWKYSVEFVDREQVRRWVTRAVTTRRPPQVGQRVVVHYDPARPAEQKRIAID